MKKKKIKLPISFKPLFWSYDFSNINLEESIKSIIVNTINYGDLRQWKWIADYYGKNSLRKEFSKIPRSEIRPQALKLAELLFSIKPSKYAYRSIDRTRERNLSLSKKN